MNNSNVVTEVVKTVTLSNGSVGITKLENINIGDYADVNNEGNVVIKNNGTNTIVNITSKPFAMSISNEVMNVMSAINSGNIAEHNIITNNCKNRVISNIYQSYIDGWYYLHTTHTYFTGVIGGSPTTIVGWSKTPIKRTVTKQGDVSSHTIGYYTNK